MIYRFKFQSSKVQTKYVLSYNYSKSVSAWTTNASVIKYSCIKSRFFMVDGILLCYYTVYSIIEYIYSYKIIIVNYLFMPC